MASDGARFGRVFRQVGLFFPAVDMHRYKRAVLDQIAHSRRRVAESQTVIVPKVARGRHAHGGGRQADQGAMGLGT